MACKHCIQIRLGFVPQFGLLLLLVCYNCVEVLSIIIISIPCPFFFFVFLKMEGTTTENNLDYIQFFFFRFVSGQTCKIDFMCKQITGEFFFLLPIHFIRFILLCFFFFFVSACVGIYKHLFQ